MVILHATLSSFTEPSALFFCISDFLDFFFCSLLFFLFPLSITYACSFRLRPLSVRTFLVTAGVFPSLPSSTAFRLVLLCIPPTASSLEVALKPHIVVAIVSSLYTYDCLIALSPLFCLGSLLMNCRINFQKLKIAAATLNDFSFIDPGSAHFGIMLPTAEL